MVEAKPATQNQVQIEANKSLPPLRGKARMGACRAQARLRGRDARASQGRILASLYERRLGEGVRPQARLMTTTLIPRSRLFYPKSPVDPGGLRALKSS